jgi:membrane associated rhomboid family serine protease
LQRATLVGHNRRESFASILLEITGVLIPYNTDAPLYHYPIATVGLIAANVFIFLGCTQAEPEQVIPWILVFGDGLHPLQWVSNNFLHADIIHLLGNMFFLWGFGLVVEGKLGWWRFLLLYFAIGAIYGAIIQIIMLGAEEGGALGASGVIFGLMAISLVWAPKNDMNCFLTFAFRATTVDVPITIFATIYLIWQGIAAWLTHFSMSSAILHLVGAGVGAVFGVVLFKLDLVDCEGWDLFAVWAGREGQRREPKATKRREAVIEEPPPEYQAQALTAALKARLEVGDAVGAAELYRKNREGHPEWRLDDADLMALVKALHKEKKHAASIGAMRDYVRQFPTKATRMRLKLADILIGVEQQPAKALKVLGRIDRSALTAELTPAYEKLVARAEKMRSKVFEMLDEGEVW